MKSDWLLLVLFFRFCLVGAWSWILLEFLLFLNFEGLGGGVGVN